MPTLSPIYRGGSLPERLRAMVNAMVASLTAAGQPYPQGKVLTAQGEGETPIWEDIVVGSPAQGDLIIANLDEPIPKWERLAAGTPGQVLIVGELTLPTWTTLAGSHAAVTLGSGSNPILALTGQEVTLANILILVQGTPPEAAKGRIYYDTDDDHLYLCTSAT